MEIFGSYVTGLCYKEFRCDGSSPRISLEYDEPQWILSVSYTDITDEELHQFQSGHIAAATTVLDGVLFFLIKFGSNPWCNVPYDPRLDYEYGQFRIYTFGSGAPMYVLTAEGRTGELKCIRLLRLGDALSNSMSRVCSTMMKNPFDFTEKNYRRRLKTVYTMFPTGEDMLPTVKPGGMFGVADSRQKDKV